MSNAVELLPMDLRLAAQRLPRDIRDLLKTHGWKLMVGGGFVRATIAGETPNDIALFGPDAEFLKNVAHGLAAQRPGSKLHTSGNAIALLTPGRLPVRFITRWTFRDAAELVASFDFTVCQAAVWRSKGGVAQWRSCIGERFYVDLAARRLTYTSPQRDEEPGGSLMRVLKYVKRGYSIQVTSLGAVIARLHVTARKTPLAETGEEGAASVLAGLLREADPLMVIDGFEIVDEHEPVEGSA